MGGGSPVVDALFARLDPFTFGARRGRGKGAGGGRAGGRGRGRGGSSSTSSPGAGTSTQDAASPATTLVEVVESLEWLQLKEKRDNLKVQLDAAITQLSLHGGRAQQRLVDALVTAHTAAATALAVLEEAERLEAEEREEARQVAQNAAVWVASLAATQVVVEAVAATGNAEAEQAAMGSVAEAVAEGVAAGEGVVAGESTPSLQARMAAAEEDVLGDLPGQAPNAANQSGVGGWSGVVRSGGSAGNSAAPSPVPSGGRRPELVRIDKGGADVPYMHKIEAYRQPTMRFWDKFEDIVRMLTEDMDRWKVPPVTSPMLYIVDGSNMFNPKHAGENRRMFKPGGQEIGMTTRSVHEAPGPAIIVMKHDDFHDWIFEPPDGLDKFFKSMRKLLSGDTFGMRPVWFLTTDISRINHRNDRGVEYHSDVDKEWDDARRARKAKGETEGVDDECRIRKWLADTGGQPKPSKPDETFAATQMIDEGEGGPEGQWSHELCEWDDVLATKLVTYFNTKRFEVNKVTQGFAMRFVTKDTDSYKTPAEVAHLDLVMPTLQKAFKYNLFRAVHHQTLRSAEPTTSS